MIISAAEGGLPARTSSKVTAASRLEKAAYMVGRYAIKRATSSRPMVASEKERTVSEKRVVDAEPRVKRDDPLRR
ncbi:MAG TPA: hypothetical protein VF823_10620 [Anaerolineales bacterium]